MQPISQDNDHNDPGRRPLWIAIGILAFLVVALAFALFERELSRPPPSAEAPSAPLERPQTAQPVDTTPIVVADQGGEGCESDDTVYEMTVAALGEPATKNATEQPVYLEDFDRVVRKYYLDLSGVPDHEKQRLSKLLTVGQHLKIRYVVCGSGGFRYLTFLQPTAAG
jgi:hypothetical protein